jgi:hypothetical protein
MFLNGCAGDIAPRRAFEGTVAAQEEGIRLATSVVKACERAVASELAPLAANSTVVHLRYQKLPTLVDIAKLKREQERTVRSEERTQARVRGKIETALKDWASSLQRAVTGELPLEPVLAETQVLRIGRLHLVGISGEPFFTVGLQILQHCPTCTWALGYCNAYSGYLPTPRAFREGGYEVSDSYKYLGLWKLSPNCSTRVVHAARHLLKKVHSPGSEG